MAGKTILPLAREGTPAPEAPDLPDCPSCEGWTGTTDCPLCHGAGFIDVEALVACAEFLAELVRSDQVMDEQADEATALLAKAGVEV